MRKPFQNATRHIGLSGLCALKGLAASNFLQTSWGWPLMAYKVDFLKCFKDRNGKMFL